MPITLVKPLPTPATGTIQNSCRRVRAVVGCLFSEPWIEALRAAKASRDRRDVTALDRAKLKLWNLTHPRNLNYYLTRNTSPSSDEFDQGTCLLLVAATTSARTRVSTC